MNKINYLLFSLLGVSSLYAGDTFNSWETKGRLSGYFQKIDVEGGNSQKEGYTHSHDLDIKYTGKINETDAGVEFKVRATNDQRIQKNDAHLLSFRGFYTSKILNYEIGDVAASMNPYVYGGSLKGAKVEYDKKEKTDNWSFKFIGGVKKSQWRETYQTTVSEPLDTNVVAIEVNYKYERAKEISFSLVTLKDDLDSGDSATTPGKEGTTFGIDGKYRFNKYIKIDGRAAIANSTNNLRGNKKKDTASAVRLRAMTRPILSSVKSNFLYERISPDFISVAGSANNDNEKIENSTTWRINKQLNSRLNLKMNRDNLDGALGDTQYTYYEDLLFTYRPESLKRANFDIKIRNKDTNGRGTDINQYILGASANYRTENGYRYGLSYDYSNTTDYINSSSSTIINNLRGIFGLRNKINEQSSYRLTATLDLQNVNRNGNDEDRYGLKLDAGYTFNKRLSSDLSYVSRHSFKESSDDSLNSTYQFRTTYRLDNEGKKTVRLLLEKRDYDVENNSSSSYNEHIGKLSYVVNF